MPVAEGASGINGPLAHTYLRHLLQRSMTWLRTAIDHSSAILNITIATKPERGYRESGHLDPIPHLKSIHKHVVTSK